MKYQVECHLAAQGRNRKYCRGLGYFLHASQDPNVMDTDEGGVDACFELAAENKDPQMTEKMCVLLPLGKSLDFISVWSIRNVLKLLGGV